MPGSVPSLVEQRNFLQNTVSKRDEYVAIKNLAELANNLSKKLFEAAPPPNLSITKWYSSLPLGQYSRLIKSLLVNLGQNYPTYIANPILPTQVSSPQNILQDPARGNLGLDFALTYLGEGTIDIVLRATFDPGLNNTSLRQLYELIVGNDGSIADNLSKAVVAPGGKKFVHGLVERAADVDTSSILNRFLDAVSHHAGAGGDAAAEQAIMNANPAGAGFPVQILLNPARVGDIHIPKIFMIKRLLKHDNGVATAAISDDYLRGQKLFSADALGQDVFKLLLSKIPAAGTGPQALRGGVVIDAYENHKGLEGAIKLAKDINKWGLNATLPGDIYQLTKNPPAAVLHEGSLLYVLTKRVIDDYNSLVDPKKKTEIMSNLRKLAEQVKVLVPDYLNYVDGSAGAGLNNSLAALKARFDATQGGWPEYALLFDRNPLDPNPANHAAQASALIFAAANLQTPFVAIKWLANVYGGNQDVLIALNGLKDADDNNYLASLMKKLTDRSYKDISALVTDFIDNLPDVAARQQAVIALNTANEGALTFLIQKLKTETRRNVHGASMASKMARFANEDAINTAIADQKDAATLLLFIRDNADAVSNTMAELKEPIQLQWLALAIGDQLKDFTSPAPIAKAFSDKLADAALPAATKRNMRDSLISGASDRDGNVDRYLKIAPLITLKFLEGARATGNDFDPFNVRAKSTLLYSIMQDKPPANIHEMKELVNAMRDLFANPADWQLYLTTQNNTPKAGPAGAVESILELLQRLKGLNEADAKSWLGFDGPVR